MFMYYFLTLLDIWSEVPPFDVWCDLIFIVATAWEAYETQKW